MLSEHDIRALCHQGWNRDITGLHRHSSIIDGVTFEEAWESSAQHLVDDGLWARYISAELLIQNKLASGRPQDLADVTAIRQARAAGGKGTSD